MFDNILRCDRSAFVREIAVFALLGTAGLAELAATSVTCFEIASSHASKPERPGFLGHLACALKEAL